MRPFWSPTAHLGPNGANPPHIHMHTGKIGQSFKIKVFHHTRVGLVGLGVDGPHKTAGHPQHTPGTCLPLAAAGSQSALYTHAYTSVDMRADMRVGMHWARATHRWKALVETGLTSTALVYTAALDVPGKSRGSRRKNIFCRHLQRMPAAQVAGLMMFMSGLSVFFFRLFFAATGRGAEGAASERPRTGT